VITTAALLLHHSPGHDLAVSYLKRPVSICSVKTHVHTRLILFVILYTIPRNIRAIARCGFGQFESVWTSAQMQRATASTDIARRTPGHRRTHRSAITATMPALQKMDLQRKAA
jgi:hypothetical protein